MDTDTTTEEVSIDLDNGGEGESETIAIPKKDYDTLNQTLGSLKRELKDLKKAKETPKEEAKDTPKNQATDSNNVLLEKAFLRSAQITDAEEVDLTLSTAKKWGMTVDQLVDDPDFQVKLDKFRTQKANQLAVSGVKGGAGQSQAKNTADYWIAKGVPPSPTDVPDRATRAKIARAMMNQAKSSKTFYND